MLIDLSPSRTHALIERMMANVEDRTLIGRSGLNRLARFNDGTVQEQRARFYATTPQSVELQLHLARENEVAGERVLQDIIGTIPKDVRPLASTMLTTMRTARRELNFGISSKDAGKAFTHTRAAYQALTSAWDMGLQLSKELRALR